MGASSFTLGFAADEGRDGLALGLGDGRVDDGDGGGQTLPAGSFRRCLGDPICLPSKCGLVGVFGSSMTFANGVGRGTDVKSEDAHRIKRARTLASPITSFTATLSPGRPLRST